MCELCVNPARQGCDHLPGNPGLPRDAAPWAGTYNRGGPGPTCALRLVRLSWWRPCGRTTRSRWPGCCAVGRDEVFRTWRALRFATAFGPLLRADPGSIGPNVAWNTERGLELTGADLSRATVLWATLTDRISAFFTEFDVLACR